MNVTIDKLLELTRPYRRSFVDALGAYRQSLATLGNRRYGEKLFNVNCIKSILAACRLKSSKKLSADTHREGFWAYLLRPNAEKGVRQRMAAGSCARPTGEVRLLTVRQAAEYLGTTTKTLYTRVWRREIPFVKLGRSLRFDLRDLDQMIEDAKVKPQEFPADPYQLGRGQ